jgi:alpha-methylacyl-CoA racemase
MQPLHGLRILDLSTMLPGPLATLLLAEAGADVLKIERPGGGDDERGYSPKWGPDAASFAHLNRGKRSLTLDLKDRQHRAQLLELVKTADVFVEQFRPGVMERLELDYPRLQRLNPRLVYCSITGYGQTGPDARRAGHDLNYVAETGLLALSPDERGRPVLPFILAGDIAGGAYPAVMNILLALHQRAQTGLGCHLDVSICDNLFTTAYWALAAGLATGAWPPAGGDVVTGASPRYQIYQTADRRYIAAAPLEEKFWVAFCAAIDLPEIWRDDARDPQGTRAAVQARIGSATADSWMIVFEGKDVCCSIVTSLEDALQTPQFKHRDLLNREIRHQDQVLPALPVPVDGVFRADQKSATYPAAVSA